MRASDYSRRQFKIYSEDRHVTLRDLVRIQRSEEWPLFSQVEPNSASEGLVVEVVRWNFPEEEWQSLCFLVMGPDGKEAEAELIASAINEADLSLSQPKKCRVRLLGTFRVWKEEHQGV